MNSGDIESLLRLLSEGFSIENTATFERIKHLEQVVQAVKYVEKMDYESLYCLFAFPFERAIDGIIEHVTPNCDAQLIFKHSHFIENHLTKLFEKYEGAACCCDKARTVIKSALRFYMTGKRIEFDYNAEYTFHLPKTMLKDHDNILLFLKALVDLCYGNSDQYLSALLAVVNEIKKPDEPKYISGNIEIR